MKLRYCFEARQEIVTPLDVYAESELEARERVLRGDGGITVYDPEYSDTRLVLLRTLDE